MRDARLSEHASVRCPGLCKAPGSMFTSFSGIKAARRPDFGHRQDLAKVGGPVCNVGGDGLGFDFARVAAGVNWAHS